MIQQFLVFSAFWLSSPAAWAAGAASAPPASLIFHEVAYQGQLSDEEARFTLQADVGADGAGSAPLLEGDVAVLPARLPAALEIVREGNRYSLVASRAGHFKFQLEMVAKIQRAEPWNQISFSGPMATIASVDAQAAGADTEVQLLSGTLLDSSRTNGNSSINGFLGADRTLALRWQARVTQVARQQLLTVDSAIAMQISPTVIKYTSKFHYDIVQGSVTGLSLALPAVQTLTHLDGGQIRDWHVTAAGDHQTLSIEFIKPVEGTCDLTLYSEQPVENSAGDSRLDPAQPLNVERESGSLTVSAEDTLVDITAPAGLRQVNAPGDAVAAYEFNARPLTLAVKLKPVEPVIGVTDRVAARLEEARLVIAHGLILDVEKAGIYTLDLTPPAGFTVADVHGDGIEDWNVSGGKIRVNFSARVLGTHQIEVQLEQSLKTFPAQIRILPLHVAGAVRETSQIGVASAPGIRLRTGALAGLREIPVNRLAGHSDEILAYATDQPDWDLAIASEHLAARVVADVFNLVTVGDGIVGGSATIRYGLVNQGVQEFKVRVPAQCKSVEFTGPNIRSKEQSGDVWTIDLQDKVWGGYTLVVTYDYQFDPAGATLPIGGLHAVEVERETGSVAVTTAASLQLTPGQASDVLQRIDESELSAADRSVITRAVVLAWQYTGGQYDLDLDVKHFPDQPVIEAVADRTQITSVLTESGEMLTQASFMVKNNEKQFQRVQLPAGATLWGCYVNGQPVKPERDGDGVLVSLPREADRDQAFSVDVMYAQTNGALASTFGKSLRLDAPHTDVPNTYAEWQLYVPSTFRLSDFGGSMNVAQGTTYELFDAWQKFIAFYGQVLHEAGGAILIIGFLAFLVIALVISAVQRGWNGVLTLLVVVAILAILSSMMLPALSSAKRKAQRISSVNNLKEIGLAAHIFAGDHTNQLPNSFEEMKDELGSDRITYDPETGQRYVYLGAGASLDALKSDSVLAYSPVYNGHCEVLYADGSVALLTAEMFGELSQRGLVLMAAPQEIAGNEQNQAVATAQFEAQPNASLRAQAVAHRGNFDGQTKSEPPVAAPAVTAANGMPGPMSASSTTSEAPGVQGTAPTAAGLRSIHIELPESGQPFLFTKVLNLRDEPLSIQTHIMPLHTFELIQMSWQTAAFLLGLAVWVWQWSRRNRNSFILTVALAMILGSLCSLLVQWRALHDALIVGFPAAALAIIALVIWKYWPRNNPPETAVDPLPPEPPLAPGTPSPVVATLVLCGILGATAAHAADARSLDQVPPSLVAATYTGTINDRVAELEATLQFSGASIGQTIPLFSDDVAVRDFTVKSGGVELVRDNDRVVAKFNRRGAATLSVKLLVKVTGDVTKRQLGFAIPPALSSQVTLTLDEAGAEVDFPAAVSFKHIPDQKRTRIEAVIGSGDQLQLAWTPRVQRAEEVAATVFCQDSARVTFGGGVINVRSIMDYQVTQGEMQQARLLLPDGLHLLRVEGKGIRTWEIKNGPGGSVLVVDLLKGVASTWRLMVEAERNLDELPVGVAVTVPRALDVKRETGLLALRETGELGVSVESSSGLQRVDAGEFASATGMAEDGLFNVFEFSRPDFALQVRVAAVHAELEAIARNNFRVGPEQVSLSTKIDYTIKHAGVFALKLGLPEGYRVEQVDGENIQQQSERTDGGGHTLELTLKDRTSGSYALAIELTRDFKALPDSLALAGVRPLDAAKLTEFVSVTAEPGVAVKTGSFNGLTEIPAVLLPDYGSLAGVGSVLAYKFISAGPTTGWDLSVVNEPVAAWVRAEIVNTITLSETFASGRARVRYDIANAPVKELRVRVPDAFRNVDITGPNIRSREQTGNLWQIELQNPIRGQYTLSVTWEQPRSGQTNAVEITGVSTDGLERETGLLSISAEAPLQVNELRAVGLQRVDTGDFPDWAGAPDPASALAYRYVRPGYQLTLEARRLGEAEVLQAIVENAQLTSVIADDGQMMTDLSLSLRSNGRQFLEVQLPPGANLWSAFVAGQPVRPGLREGKLLLPIEQLAADDGPTSLELTYVGTNAFPRAHGKVGFVSPQLDVPLKNARWEIYLPPDYDYKNFSGSMTRELTPAPESISTSFSILEYSRMEQASKSAAQVDVQRDVDQARRQLTLGDVRGANADFSRAKAKLVVAGQNNDDVKQLEKDLQNAQASNLVAAQNDFTVRNYWSAGGEAGNGPALTPQPGSQYDNAAAELQWSKLQQAQEILAAKVQPLHANLPVRGLHYGFAQVLQTEASRPMTIELLASSTKVTHWPTRILTLAGLFLLLWGLVSATSRFARHRAA